MNDDGYDSHITRQQYHRIQDQKKRIYSPFNRFKHRNEYDPDREYRIRLLSKRLNKLIAILVIMIVAVYLILVFVNF